MSKLLLTTFYVFLKCQLKKVKKRVCELSKKRKIRILEHQTEQN